MIVMVWFPKVVVVRAVLGFVKVVLVFQSIVEYEVVF